MSLWDKFTILSSGKRHNSSNTSRFRRLSAKKRWRKDPAKVVTILLERLESLRDTGVMVPSVADRETSEGFLAVVEVLVEPYEAKEPLR